MIIGLTFAALIFCGASVFCFCKANYCACTQAGQCDNPVNHYWLGAIANALISLLLCCAALHSEKGSLLWLVLMASCFSGALVSAKHAKKQGCKKSQAKPTNALLTNEPN